MPMSASELDAAFKLAARNQLRTFNKTITTNINITVTNGDLVFYHYSEAESTVGWPTPEDLAVEHEHSVSGSSTFSLADANESVYTGDLDPGIGSGLVADADDVAVSISNAVLSTVTAIESELSVSPALSFSVCHNSCHASCHSSRGRR